LALADAQGTGHRLFFRPPHYIEHTLDEFADEIARAGLKIESQDVRWGEIWAVCALVNA